MKNAKLLLFVLVGFLLTVGCNKEKDLNITMNVVESGNLSITVTDDNGAGLANLNVVLNGYGSELEDAMTDANGVVSFSDLLSDNYTVEIEDAVVGGKTYHVNQIVQVISGKTKNDIINPTEFVGSIEITVYRYTGWENEEIPGLNVTLLKEEDYKNDMTYEEVMEVALVSSITNSEGIVFFDKLPFGYYAVFISEDTENYNTYSFININRKGQELITEIQYYPSN
jgi:hypothetical protein